ncbi:MAG TPA: hypothetical protein VNA15_00345 [Candidatus Angelobacter sp.]|nr:hypothetical protein [Candidatus Angelobacter sp.]
MASLGVHSVVRFTKGYGVVTIRAVEAVNVGIFNPEVESCRRILLERLVRAKTFPRHWPHWLEEKVNGLIRSGLGKREICERVLQDDNTYIKMQSLKRKMQGPKMLILKSV